MPVRKVGDKFAIGSGKPIYDSKEKAERAYKGYLGSKYGNMKKDEKSGAIKFNENGQWALKAELSTAHKVGSAIGEGARAVAGAVGSVVSHPIQAGKDSIAAIGHGIKNRSVTAVADKMANSKSTNRAMKISNALKTEPKEKISFTKNGQWKVK